MQCSLWALLPLTLCLADPLEDVKKLKPVMQQVLGQTDLSASLRAEASKVAADVDRALRGRPEVSTLMSVNEEYKQFMNDAVQEELSGGKKEAAPEASGDDAAPEADETEEASPGEAKMVEADMEDKVRSTIERLEKQGDKGMNTTEIADRDALLKQLKGALAGPDAALVAKVNSSGVSDSSAAAHALAMHDAMEAAQDFFLRRTEALMNQEEQLKSEINHASTHVLYEMLKQRKKLPMKSQLAILKRKQFKDCPYAAQLLKTHSSSLPLYEQLEKLVPKDMVEPAEKKVDAGHLAAAGSDGRVLVVSSALKSRVKGMVAFLKNSRDKLAKVAAGSVGAERKQAREIVASMDQVLSKANSTTDLKSQLEVMDEMQAKIVSWFMSAQGKR